MKFRILKANQVYNTWAKYGIFTSDNQFYCPYFEFNIPKIMTAFVDDFNSLYPIEKKTKKPICYSNYHFFTEEISFDDIRINERKMILEYLKKNGLSESDWDDSSYKLKSVELPSKYFNINETITSIEYFSIEDIKEIGKPALLKVLENYKSLNDTDELLNEIRKKFPNLGKLNNEEWKFPLWAYAQYFTDLKVDSKDEIKLNSEDVQVIISSIELYNFGRFLNLSPILLGQINFFVGPNNGGKSTFINAIKIIDGFFKAGIVKSIDKLSIFKKEESKSISNYSNLRNHNTKIKIHLKDKSLEIVDWKVTYEFKDEIKNFHLLQLKFENDFFSMSINPQQKKYSIELFELNSEIINSDEYQSKNEIFSETYDIKNFENDLKIDELFSEFFNEIKKNKESTNQIAFSKFLFPSLKSVFLLQKNLRKINIYDLGHDVMKINQNLKFASKKNKLPLNKKLNNLFELGLLNGENENLINLFFHKWLSSTQGFQLCENFNLTKSLSSKLTFNLIDKFENKKPIYELGLGSQRVIELLVNIAHFIFFELGIKKNEPSENERLRPFIIIEEPEAHLHPNWQSKLANLFFDLNKEFKLRFIIETHSEYIIRNTQLITFINKQNPFSVTYFDSNNAPYSMELDLEGRFKNDFGSGFMDEATEIVFKHFELLNKSE